MRRLLLLAMLLAAFVFGAALLLQQPEQRPIGTKPDCGDPSTCGADAPAPAEPTVPAPVPSPGPVATPPVQPSQVVPADGAALRDEADRLLAEGKVVDAIAVFRKAVEAAPTAKNHGDFGGLLYRLTAFDEAALHLRAAAELDSGNADRWIALANVYYRKVNPGEAWKAEKRAREAEPGLELGRDAAGMRARTGATAPREP